MSFLWFPYFSSSQKNLWLFSDPELHWTRIPISFNPATSCCLSACQPHKIVPFDIPSSYLLSHWVATVKGAKTRGKRTWTDFEWHKETVLTFHYLCLLNIFPKIFPRNSTSFLMTIKKPALMFCPDCLVISLYIYLIMVIWLSRTASPHPL